MGLGPGGKCSACLRCWRAKRAPAPSRSKEAALRTRCVTAPRPDGKACRLGSEAHRPSMGGELPPPGERFTSPGEIISPGEISARATLPCGLHVPVPSMRVCMPVRVPEPLPAPCPAWVSARSMAPYARVAAPCCVRIATHRRCHLSSCRSGATWEVRWKR